MKMAQRVPGKPRWVVRAVKPAGSPRSSTVIPPLGVKGKSVMALAYS